MPIYARAALALTPVRNADSKLHQPSLNVLTYPIPCQEYFENCNFTLKV